jgi:alkylation response protein AidB-like acyl-CoA dehydrogenase
MTHLGLRAGGTVFRLDLYGQLIGYWRSGKGQLMEFSAPTQAEQSRTEAQEFLAAAYPDELRRRRFERPYDKQFHQALQAWKREHLVSGDPYETSAFYREAAASGIDQTSFLPTEMIAETIADLGTDEQRRDIVPKMRAADYLVALGLTEPDAGSDLAAARTRAVRDGDEWVIDGQKIYTSNAQHATHVFLLTRTNTEVRKHKGLTVFLVPIDTPGVEVRPVHTLAYHHTNMTFYTNVRVPDSCRIGDVDGGWEVMKIALGREQGGEGSTDLPELVRQAIEWAEETDGEADGRMMDDPVIRERIARAAVDLEVATLLAQRSSWATANQIPRNPGWGPGSKLFETEAYSRAAADFFAMAGPAAVVPFEEDGTVRDGWFNYTFRDAPVRLIGGGVSEVMREIIAERRIGLPRARPT